MRRPMGAAPPGSTAETVKPALLVLALAVLMSVVLPLINSKTPYRHPVHRGEIAELADGVTLVPAAGWDLATGALARPHALAGGRHRLDRAG